MNPEQQSVFSSESVFCYATDGDLEIYSGLCVQDFVVKDQFVNAWEESNSKTLFK